MGTWGTQNFDNDVAIDWANIVVEEDDIELIVVALKEIDNEEEYIEAPECIEALCAIEVLAALKAQRFDFLPEELASWVKKVTQEHNKNDEPLFSATTYKLALRVVHRIISESELQELWEESDYYQEWMDVQKRLAREIE